MFAAGHMDDFEEMSRFLLLLFSRKKVTVKNRDHFFMEMKFDEYRVKHTVCQLSSLATPDRVHFLKTHAIHLHASKAVNSVIESISNS